VAWPHYDDYIAFDVVHHVDAKYRSMPLSSRRALGGLSMGGYGAIMLALQYPGTFSAAASHSGVLSPMEFAPRPVGQGLLPRASADSAAMAGFRARNAERFRIVFGSDSSSWMARDPATLVARIAARGAPMPALFADAGTEDPFTAESRAFVQAMRTRGVAVNYHEWPGGHTWEYWRTHVGESLTWIAAQIAPSTGR
jgi:S-formylglutathione hydrolase FrmB